MKSLMLSKSYGSNQCVFVQHREKYIYAYVPREICKYIYAVKSEK